jgi:hypothetical protein
MNLLVNRGTIIDGNEWFAAVLRIRIRIRSIHMLSGLPDPDPLVRDTVPDPSVIKQK